MASRPLAASVDMPAAGDKFDLYREALVVECDTLWSEDAARLVPDPTVRAQIEQRLHAEPAQAAVLHYLRLYTGFCRRITVTVDDLKRLGVVQGGEAPAGEASQDG
jgi:nicotinamide riboside kinase